ncbi:Epoxide hydrolase N terminus [Streptoalloteichus hindustanus]|uniref:Epoxide hydrolase N terminus n=1 Tax=Streptoalloteichus hindustanus TaxID=2017 RepID=A0A1M5EPC0_STRHI|nr:Epoxide hydrolase N terminus [Streptoalloteichus hindustanus]
MPCSAWIVSGVPAVSTEIRPFRVDVRQSDLDDLNDRLARTRWGVRLPGEEWNRGVPVDYLRDLAEYWRTGYDWHRHEARLNDFPQYVTEIDGLDVHFPHVRAGRPAARPHPRLAELGGGVRPAHRAADGCGRS